jgi:hypothetical protein
MDSTCEAVLEFPLSILDLYPFSPNASTLSPGSFLEETLLSSNQTETGDYPSAELLGPFTTDHCNSQVTSDFMLTYSLGYYIIIMTLVVGVLYVYTIRTLRTRRVLKEEDGRAVEGLKAIMVGGCPKATEDMVKKWIGRKGKRQISVQVRTICCDQEVVRLPCRHSFCIDQFRAMLTNSANCRRAAGVFKCHCSADIPLSLAKQAFPPPVVESLRNSQQIQFKLTSSKPASTPSFTCQICDEQYLVEHAVTLDCDHRYCCSCLQEHIAYCVTQGQFTDLACPRFKCSTVISESIIQAQVPSELVGRLTALRLSHLKDSATERTVTCPKCSTPYYVSSHEEKAVRCNKCRTKIPVKAQDLENIQGVKRCPKCKGGVIKDGGCYFVKCTWFDCSCIFCLLCEKEVSALDHYAHYPDGPYVDRCKNL